MCAGRTHGLALHRDASSRTSRSFYGPVAAPAHLVAGDRGAVLPRMAAAGRRGRVCCGRRFSAPAADRDALAPSLSAAWMATQLRRRRSDRGLLRHRQPGARAAGGRLPGGARRLAPRRAEGAVRGAMGAIRRAGGRRGRRRGRWWRSDDHSACTTGRGRSPSRSPSRLAIWAVDSAPGSSRRSACSPWPPIAWIGTISGTLCAGRSRAGHRRAERAGISYRGAPPVVRLARTIKLGGWDSNPQPFG